MDPFLAEEIAHARQATPEARLLEALQVMADGFEVKRASLRLRFPLASEAEIEERLWRWASRADDE